MRHPRPATRARRRAYSLLEVGIAIGLIGLVALWALPRFVGGEEVIGDGTAQAHVDLAMEAALAVRRDLGAFDDTAATLEVYTSDVAVLGPSTTALVPDQVSIGIASPGSTLSQVAAAAVTEDGTCWMARRSFGTADFEVLYGFSRTGTCNADLAATLVPVVGDPEAGSRWSRPIDLTP